MCCFSAVNKETSWKRYKKNQPGWGLVFLLPLGLPFPFRFLLFVFCTSPFLQLLYYFFSLMEEAGSYHSSRTLLVSDLFSLGIPEALRDELKSGSVCSSTHF